MLVFPGTYTLNLCLKRQGSSLDDEVDNAIQFTVDGADVTGHNPYFERYSFSKAEVYCPSDWTHTTQIDQKQRQAARGSPD